MTSTGNPWDVLSSTNRTPRTLETREHSARRKSWAPPSILPDPTPRDGKSFKWVRAETRGSADKVTYAKRLREGWEPVNAVDHPEIVGELKLGQSEHGLIETGGLILCWMATETVEERRQHYRRMSTDQIDSAEQSYMRDSDERMKKVAEKKRQFVYGR
jgi:hypothetical protein